MAAASRGSDPDAGMDPAAQAYADRAYPFSGVGIAQTLAADRAAKKIKGHVSKHFTGWQEVGPFTLDVQPLATQTFNRPTQWSGRVTALAIGPSCGKGPKCTLYVAAAGGGVWRTDDALAGHPHWTPISGDIPSTAIGSLLIDPTDPTGQTIYAGTGEESGSSDSEAGIGLYKSTDGGSHWSLVAGSPAVSNNRSIGAISVDPHNAQHIFIGTDVARHGASSVERRPLHAARRPEGRRCTSRPTAAPRSTRCSAGRPTRSTRPRRTEATSSAAASPTCSSTRRTRSTLYASITDYGLFRSADSGTTLDADLHRPGRSRGLRHPLRVRADDARERQDADLPRRGPERVHRSGHGQPEPGLGLAAAPDGRRDGRGGVHEPVELRPERRRASARSTSARRQCSYDMFVASPAGHPDTVWLGGSMQYGELPPYAGADSSDGRARHPLDRRRHELDRHDG